MRTVFLATGNPEKSIEGGLILAEFGIRIEVVRVELKEVLSLDESLVIREKVKSAFSQVLEPVYVDHGGLYIKYLNDLPGALSKPIVDALKTDLCKIIPPGADRSACASLSLGYCDGRRIHVFSDDIQGAISKEPRGARDYYYDQIFIPNGQSKTYAEMTIEEKNKMSHLRGVYRQFGRFLSNEG